MPILELEDTAESLAVETERLRDNYRREGEEFAHYRRQLGRFLRDAHGAGREELLRTLLPVLDRLDRAFGCAMCSANRQELVVAITGIRDVLSQASAILAPS